MRAIGIFIIVGEVDTAKDGREIKHKPYHVVVKVMVDIVIITLVHNWWVDFLFMLEHNVDRIEVVSFVQEVDKIIFNI